MERLGSAWRVTSSVRLGGAATDERLAASAGAGDAEAFRVLAQRYTQPAFNYAYHVLGTYDDAQDAVQEALIQIFQSLPTARQELSFRPWFYRILRNKCLDALRRRKPFLRLSGSDDEGHDAEDSFADTLPDTAALPEELFERHDLQQMLHAVIAELPTIYREVVLLRYVSDLTFEEIGATLNASVNTVKTRFQRAKHADVAWPGDLAQGASDLPATGEAGREVGDAHSRRVR